MAIGLISITTNTVHTLPRLDVMVAYSCNLACKGCISLSDWPRDGVEPRNNLVRDLHRWSQLISPDVVTIFGGEPTLHPELIEVCQDVRKAWPDSTIRLITNGYLLNRIDPKFWFTLGQFEMQISIHRKDHEHIINQNIKSILKEKTAWQIKKFVAQDHRQVEWRKDNVSVYKSIFQDFIIPYQLKENKIEFWNSDPKEAHKICGAPNTPVLYRGKLYKCPAVANIIDVAKTQIVNYQGCDGNNDLAEFISNIGQPESVCGQCPDRTKAQIINHFDPNNVIVKQKISN